MTKKILLLLAAAAVITMLIPQRTAAPFTIYVGQVWYADDVVAPFDIALTKPSSDLAAERRRIEATFEPIYRLDTVVAARRATALDKMLAAQASVSDAARREAVDLLREFYRAGVVGRVDAQNLQNKTLRRVVGQTIETVRGEDLYSIQEATEQLSALEVVPGQGAAAYVSVNLTYDGPLSEAMLREAKQSVGAVDGMVRKGEVIIKRDEVVTPEKFNTLQSMIRQNEIVARQQNNPWTVRGAQAAILVVVLLVNLLFFSQFATHYFGQGMREFTFVVALYLLMAGLLSVVARIDGVSPYVVPLPVVAAYCLAFFNMRVAVLANLSVAFIGAMFVRQPFDFFAINMLTGMVAILMMRHNYHRGFLIRAVGVILLTAAAVYTAFALLREGSWGAIPLRPYVWLTVSSFLMLAFYQAIYLLERLFGFVSDITLLELCDTNQPLLLELAQGAPGTFQHSVQVANLAESAAKEIGANALLCRTGALYHDIGKMSNPFYFVENLTGVFNPHNDCTPAQSAEIVRSHVTEGVATAKRHKLPARVVDFITSHHGESLIYYFWVEAQKIDPAAHEEEFRYPGPKPVSKEVSICMMADAVEAASRSLPSYDKEPLEALVDQIVDTQVQSGQLSESELSFAEIDRIKTVFKAKLSNIYHGRIAYPVRTENKKEEKSVE